MGLISWLQTLILYKVWTDRNLKEGNIESSHENIEWSSLRKEMDIYYGKPQ